MEIGQLPLHTGVSMDPVYAGEDLESEFHGAWNHGG